MQEFKVKWSRTKKMYTEPVKEYVSVHWQHLNVSYAEFFRFTLQFLGLQMCMYGGSAVPQGGGVIW